MIVLVTWRSALMAGLYVMNIESFTDFTVGDQDGYHNKCKASSIIGMVNKVYA